MTASQSAFEPSPAPSRQSALAERHERLGGSLTAAWNDMAVVADYGDPFEEILSVRTRAGLFDISAHKLIAVSGPDAAQVLDRMLACQVAGMRPGTAQAGCILDQAGGLIDDLLVLCCGEDNFRLSHGSGSTAEALRRHAANADIVLAPDHQAHLLSLQGPAATPILAPLVPVDLDGLGYFAHVQTSLFGTPIRLMRGGYSGEAGFEIECGADAIAEVWDGLLEAGRNHAIRPAGWSCLETLRIESGLLFYPFEMPHRHTTPWEVGMGGLVARTKPDFCGRSAVLAAEGRERSWLAGLSLEHDHAVPAGAAILVGGEPAGTITSATFSRYLMQSIAIAALAPVHCRIGTEVEVDTPNGRFAGLVVRMPFYDPMRLRLRGG